MTRATARSTSPSGRTTTPRTTTPRTATPRTATPRTTTPRTTTPRTSGETRGVRSGTRTTPRPELRLIPGVAAAGPRRRPASFLRHRRAPFVLLVVALLVGTTLGLLVLNTVVAVDSLKATQLRTANTHRAEELQSLEQKVVNGSTPAQIAREAAAGGLVPAGIAAHLVISPDGSSVLRGTPEPAPATGAAGGGN